LSSICCQSSTDLTPLVPSDDMKSAHGNASEYRSSFSTITMLHPMKCDATNDRFKNVGSNEMPNDISISCRLSPVTAAESNKCSTEEEVSQPFENVQNNSTLAVSTIASAEVKNPFVKSILEGTDSSEVCVSDSIHDAVQNNHGNDIVEEASVSHLGQG